MKTASKKTLQFNAAVRKLQWVRGILQSSKQACGIAYHRGALCWLVVKRTKGGLRVAQKIKQTLETVQKREMALILIERCLAVEMLGNNGAIRRFTNQQKAAMA
jgi:hypothetical protein